MAAASRTCHRVATVRAAVSRVLRCRARRTRPCRGRRRRSPPGWERPRSTEGHEADAARAGWSGATPAERVDRATAGQSVLRSHARGRRRHRRRVRPAWPSTAASTNTAELPLGLTSTVDSARAVLSTIAGATITFAGIAFSVSLLIIQLASSQYSPRVVHTLFRDPFNRRVMGLVVGTFTYCVIVLRSVRSPLEQGGQPIIPNLSVARGGAPRHRHDPRHRRVHQPQRPHHGRERDPRTRPARSHRPHPPRVVAGRTRTTTTAGRRPGA